MGFTKTTFKYNESSYVTRDISTSAGSSSSWSGGTYIVGFLYQSGPYWQRVNSHFKITTDSAGVEDFSFSVPYVSNYGSTAIGWTITTGSSTTSTLVASGSCTKTSGSALTGSYSSLNLSASTTYYFHLLVADVYTASAGFYGNTLTIAGTDRVSADTLSFTNSSGTSVTSLTLGTSSSSSSYTLSWTNNNSAACTYTLYGTYTDYNGDTRTITLTSGVSVSAGSSKSYTWTPTVTTFDDYITTAKYVNVKFTLTTVYSSTTVGTSTKTIKCSFPSTVAPFSSGNTYGTITPTLSDGCGNSTITGMGIYVQGYSKLTITLPTLLWYDTGTSSGTAITGSLSSWTMTVDGTTTSGITSTSATSAVLTSSGTVSYSLTVTDARGYTATASGTITVVAYSKPTITLSLSTTYRCDSTGTADDEGTYILIHPVATYSSLSNNNSITIVPYGKQASASTYSLTFDAVTNNADSILAVSSSPYSTFYNTVSWTIKATVTDTVGNTATATLTIGPSQWAIHFRLGSGTNGTEVTGAAIGKAAEYDGELQIPSTWDYYRGTDIMLAAGDLTVQTTAQSSVAIASGGYDDLTIDVSKTGYTPLCLVGYKFSSTASSWCYVNQAYLSGTDVVLRIRNTYSSASSLTVTVYVLYITDR